MAASPILVSVTPTREPGPADVADASRVVARVSHLDSATTHGTAANGGMKQSAFRRGAVEMDSDLIILSAPQATHF